MAIDIRPIIAGLQVEMRKNIDPNDKESQIRTSKLFAALDAIADNIRELERRVKVLEG